MKVTFNISNANAVIEDNKLTLSLNTAELKEVAKAIQNLVPLSSLNPKDTFKIGDETFIVLEKNANEVKVIRIGFAYSDKKFGENSDWKTSPVRELLNGEYYDRIAAVVGEDAIIPFERDLTSLDGLDDYGTCVDKISLLTAAEYAKYHKILGLMSNYPDWWWTITPYSTPSNDYSRGVCYVRSFGALGWGGCGYGGGVRPFLILDSSTLVSR